MKFNKAMSVITGLSFCLLIFFLGYKSFPTLSSELKTIFSSEDKEADIQSQLNNIETTLKSKFSYKHEAADIYGLGLNILNKNIVGNFEFYKSENDVTSRFESVRNVNAFANSMNELSVFFEKTDTPLIFMRSPEHILTEEEAEFGFYNEYTASIDGIISDFSEHIDVLDFNQVLSEEELKNFYFRTDVHPTTQSGFLTANVLCEYLNNNYNLEFKNMDVVFNKENYNINSYDFLGNTSRNSGRYFSGIDTFEILHPKFETSLEMYVFDTDEKRSGSYDEVCLNSYEDRDNITEYTYWVTNYLQYPNFHYTIKNNLSDGPKLLVIADSMYLVNMSFLALTSSEITIIDTRQADDPYQLANVISGDEYDAVIVGGVSAAFYSKTFKSTVNIPDIETKTPVKIERYHNMHIDKCNEIKPKEPGEIIIEKNAKKNRIVGWAIDPDNKTTFSDLYLKIGGNTFKCNYGYERPSIAKHFKSDTYNKSGFVIELDASYFYDENGNLYPTLQFIQISSDGTYMYEPVTYTLKSQ